MTAPALPGALAGACPDVREAGPDDAVAGVRPRFAASPASVDEASALLRAAAAEGLAVVPRGTATKLTWGNPPARCDLVVDTRRLNRVLEHAAGDLVAAVEAGVGLDQLAGVLGAAGQRLPLDPPGGGTVAGVLASAAAGPLRLRYGTGRDLLIGITVVRADGTVARSGGKVVKNVAGYDLGKLFAGSYGTLGLIAEATFRLHPAPAAASYVTLDCAGADEADAVIAAADGSPLAPSAAEIDREARGGPIRAGILLEGDPDGVAERCAALTRLLGSETGSTVSPGPPPWWGRGAAAASGGTVVRIAFWAAALPAVLRAVDAAGQACGLDPAVSGSAAAAVLYAAVAGAADPAAVSEFVGALRAAVAAPADGAPATPTPLAAGGPPSRGSVVVLHAPAAVRAVTDLWGPVPALGLMRAVKDQFDPEHRMAPGRFAGGI
jgi:glycolate oxidase FAD binding subunit